MGLETGRKDSGVVSLARKVPLDVRIVAYYLYANALLCFVSIPFVVSGSSEPQSHRVLLGLVLIASTLADSVYNLTTGICYLLCAWGLMRRAQWAWWFSLIFFVYASTDALLFLPGHRVTVAMSVAIDIALITWLWFRRDLFGNNRDGNNRE
jgi:lysylphosphatidylglycerol synthetase-like protein (DUF2156 family)